MSERLRYLEEIAKTVEVVDTTKVGVDHPVIASLYEDIFNVTGRIQPSSPAYETAQKVLDKVERGDSLDQINMKELETVFEAAGAHFERLI